MSISNIFNVVLQATILGGVVGIIIFILKSTVLRKLSAKWQCLLWSVMIIKLIFPNGPESNISVFNKIKVTEIISESDVIQIAHKATSSVKTDIHTFNILPYIWFTGCIIVFLWMFISFLILNHKMHSSAFACKNTIEILDRCKKITGVKRNIKIIVQNHIPTAALYGIICPKILITNDFEKSEPNHMEYTFIHELSHYRRGDAVINYLLLFLRCVHWFNPVVWFLFSKIKRDTELATDEKTIMYLKPGEHKSYGMTLINTLSVHSVKSPALLGMANNKQDIKKRIKAISKFKKPNFIHHFSGILTITLIASVCLTSAVIAKPITNIIYEAVPEIIVTENNAKQKTELTLSIEKPAPPSEPEADVKDTITEEVEYSNIDIVISHTGKKIHNASGTIDIKNYAKLINYNSDSRDRNHLIIKPNTDGSIQILIEEQSNNNYMIPVDISNINTPGYGWSYGIPSDNNSPFYIDGLDPNEEYIVFIDTYCPGYYGIKGKILIY